MHRDDVIEATFLEGLDYMDPMVGCEVTGTGRQVGDFRGVESPSAPTLGFDLFADLQQMGKDAADFVQEGAQQTMEPTGWEPVTPPAPAPSPSPAPPPTTPVVHEESGWTDQQKLLAAGAVAAVAALLFLK